MQLLQQIDQMRECKDSDKDREIYALKQQVALQKNELMQVNKRANFNETPASLQSRLQNTGNKNGNT